LTAVFVSAAISACTTPARHEVGQPDNIQQCGQTLDVGEGIPVVYQLPQPPQQHLPLPIGLPAIVRVSSSCNQGAAVTFAPPDAVRIIQEIRAKNVLPVELWIASGPIPRAATITAVRDGHVVGTLPLMAGGPSAS
jgi:hypothetical protein